MSLPRKAYYYWRAAGTVATGKRIIQYLRVRAAMAPVARPADLPIPGIDTVIEERFRALTPLSTFSTETSGPRVTIVTDSISRGSLFGGVGTALMLGALAAQRLGGTLRIVTRTEAADAAALKPLLEINGIRFDRRTEFCFLPPESRDQLSVHALDRFITTSWWTTTAAGRLPKGSIFYLLQEDERMFYPAGDDLLRCERVMSDPSVPLLVNSKLLFDHLVQSIPDMAARGAYFEPAFPRTQFYREPRAEGTKRTLMFYARPNNPRNLFYLGCEVLRRALEEGIIDPDAWRLVLCGRDIPRLTFNPSIEVSYAENLRWDEYARIVRGSDLGLSLMLTPHPSYPPLDLAAAGAVVVTNTWGTKTDLRAYSENILVAPPDADHLVEALRRATEIVSNEALRTALYEASGLQRDWSEALRPMVDRVAGSLP